MCKISAQEYYLFNILFCFIFLLKCFGVQSNGQGGKEDLSDLICPLGVYPLLYQLLL